MEHLPHRLGQDRALDDAVRLICASGPEATLDAYGRTLRSLQASIDRSLSSEALGAATLLQMHDFFSRSNYQTWAVHATGVIGMLQARGSKGIESGFDRCLLQAQVGNITFAALRERKPCFLALPAWNGKVNALSRYGEDGEEKYSWEMKLIAIGVQIPGLICQLEALHAGRKKTPGGGSWVNPDMGFSTKLQQVRHELEDALEQAGDFSESLYGSDGAVTNRIRPALLLSANIYLMIIDYMLKEVKAGNAGSALPGEGPSGPGPEPSHVLTLEKIKSLYQTLSDVDAVALRSTVDMLKLTLSRVLDASNGCGAPMGSMEEVCHLLGLKAVRLGRQQHTGTASITWDGTEHNMNKIRHRP